jgi:LmbE family N-acetylglucosaminyl deacetylase
VSRPFDHRDPGTAETEWAQARPWEKAGRLPLDFDALIVLAAHPDDETLGAGGLLRTCADRGVPASVVIVTDGEASHPSAGGTALRARRRTEAVEAVASLHPSVALTFLGITDGGVREAREEIARSVSALVATIPGRVLIAAPWRGDGHRDHRVLGEIADDLAGADVDVVGYPVWMWHWASPAEVDVTGWRVLRLDADTTAAKATALSRYTSQLESDEPMLHAGMRAHFARDVEVFVAAPADTSGPGDAYFTAKFARDADPWGFDTRWYERRKRDLILGMLPRRRFARALEVGCATGALTERLADRAADVLGIDLADAALDRARERCAPLPQVAFARMRVPEEWPDARFDLVVVSEMLYYLDAAERAALAQRVQTSLTDDGVVVAGHWRRPIREAAASGDAVHAEIARWPGLARTARYLDDDVVIDVYARSGASVADAEGLT